MNPLKIERHLVGLFIGEEILEASEVVSGRNVLECHRSRANSETTVDYMVIIKVFLDHLVENSVAVWMLVTFCSTFAQVLLTRIHNF